MLCLASHFLYPFVVPLQDGFCQDAQPTHLADLKSFESVTCHFRKFQNFKPDLPDVHAVVEQILE